MSKWIKNSSGTLSTYGGQDIQNGSYYEIQSHQEVSWANDSVLLTDIGNGDAIVAKDDSGTNDITDVNDGINYLKGNLPTQVQTLAVSEPNGKRARLVGCIFGTATANSLTDHDWLIPQMQYPPGTNVNSIFDGIQYYCKDSKMGDKLQFQVIDKDGTGVTLGLYPQAYYDAYKDENGVLLVEEFGDSWYVAPNNIEDIVLYKARLLQGLYLRVKYDNTHATNNTEFFINLFRHLDP